MTIEIFKNYIPTEKEENFILQVIYYDCGKYQFVCYPVNRTKSECGRFSREKSLAYSGYKTVIHTCGRRSKKQDDFAILEAKKFYEKNKLTSISS